MSTELTPGPFDLTASRLNKGMSPAELAEAVGVSYKTVRRLEMGLGVRPASAKKVADYFGVLVTDLMPIEKKEAA